jgi:16S rRNA (cytosine1402-N4)-methyltransferase
MAPLDMADPATPVHVPVLLAPVLAAAAGSRRAVDATLGDGGHAEALRRAGAEVLGIDRDPAAMAVSRRRLGEEGMHYVEAPYGSAEALAAVAAFQPDFILLDLGVSSRQLDETARGFTFRPGAPLDMRMGAAGTSAAELLNGADEAELARVFAEYGDERQSRRLAREIVRRRVHHPFAISDDLVNAVRATLGARAGPSEFARLFQAVRIEVNDELAGLARALPALRDALAPGGRLAVIT